MIGAIRADLALQQHIVADCLENGVGAVYEPGLSPAHEVTLDVDSYYSTLRLAQTPPTADRVVVVRCRVESEGFGIYVVEMKNVRKPAYFEVRNVYSKYQTAIDDFMKVRFQHVFLSPAYSVKSFKIYFVTDAYRLSGKSFTAEEIRRSLIGTRLEMLLLMPPFEFRGKYYLVEYRLPNPLITRP